MTDSIRSDSESEKNQIATIIDNTGLPDTIKGRAKRFILRWIAGSIAHPYVRQIRENLDEIEGRSRVNMMLAEEVGRLAVADPVIVERAKARFLGNMLQQQDNVENVARIAQEKLDTMTEEEISDSAGMEEPGIDWMNAFTRQAENATSDELRERLASILAGEIRKPGTFSRSTLRIIAEMDQETLLEFRETIQNRVGHYVIREQDWNSGKGFDRGVMLEDAGLISGSSGLTNLTIRTDENGVGVFTGKTHGIAVIGTPRIEKHVGVWLITRAGLEVASLLPDPDEMAGLRRVADMLDRNQISKIVIGRAIISDNRISVAHDEVPWTLPNTADINRQ